MYALNDSPAPRSAPAWWRWGSPARSGLQRVIPPWEYRHLRAWAGVNFIRGFVLGILGLLLLPYSASWAALPLAAAAAVIALGIWEMAIDRSRSART
jgi:hypothetical protein